MKFLKSIILLIILITIYFKASANGSSSGYGCNLGNVIYTQKMGTSKFYGNDYDVYNSNGTRYAIDWNNTSTPNQINSDSIVDQRETCWVNSYVNPKNNNTGVSWGTLVQYTVNNNQTNVPLDDYVGLILILVAGTGAFALYKKQLISSQL